MNAWRQKEEADLYCGFLAEELEHVSGPRLKLPEYANRLLLLCFTNTFWVYFYFILFFDNEQKYIYYTICKYFKGNPLHSYQYFSMLHDSKWFDMPGHK